MTRMKVLTKVLVTLFAGGITYLITNLTEQPEIWQITMSVFVAGVGLVVNYLIDHDNRVGRLEATQEQHTSRVEDVLDRRFTEISEATALYARVEHTVLRPDQVTRLVAAATDLPGDELVRRFADHELTRLTALFEGLRSGWAFYEGEDREWLLGLTACATMSIDATSMTSFDDPQDFVDDDEFWESDLGQRYLAAQRRAVQERHVRVRRLFLLTDARPDDDKRIAEMIEPHQRIGAEIRLLRPSDIDFLVRNDMVDFVLFDGALSYELRTASTIGPEGSPTIADVTLVADPERVARRRQRFDMMWEAAGTF